MKAKLYYWDSNFQFDLLKFADNCRRDDRSNPNMSTLKANSPKHLKHYLSGSNLCNYYKQPSAARSPANQCSIMPKKSISPGFTSLNPTQSINKMTKGGTKLVLKYDNNKKYLFNSTTYGTPLDRSMMPSYISTPNEKSFNLNAKTFTNAFDDQLKPLRAIKRVTKISQNQEQQQNSLQNNVKVQFIIDFKFQKKSPKGTSNNTVNRTIHRTYLSFVTFESLKREFLNDKECLPQEIKNESYGLIGFQTVPYNHTISQLINNDPTISFEYFLEKGVHQLCLHPVIIKNPLNYDCLKFKDFQILEHLGSGGFSTVYLAKCLIDGQFCALKFIQKSSVTTPKKVKMLENERDILFQISHPNLVQMYYAFETANYIIFGLQYCPLGNLYSFLQKKKSLTEQENRFIFRQILNGVEYLHEHNILFRDIKLENILFDVQGNIKITDFGLSKPEIKDQQITYSYCGSPEYMAPEMIAKQGHSFEVDYYALGILLYELFYGRSPFYAQKKQQIFLAIMNNEPTFPKSPAVSKQAKALIKGLLAKNPKHRIGSLKGIKQIGSHPWLRGYKISNVEPHMFNLAANFESSTFPIDSRKLKQTFQQERQCPVPIKTFFEENFVNRSLYERVSKKMVVMRDVKDKCIGKKKIKQNILNYENAARTDGNSNAFKKQKRIPKSGSKSKYKSKKCV